MPVRSRSGTKPSRSASPTVTDQALGRRFTRLWLATALSNMADGALVVGAPLLAVALTRSPLLVALTSTLAMAPWLVVPLLAGALADRHDRRLIIIAVAWLRAALLAGAAAAAATGAVSIGVLYVLVLLVGTCEVFADTTTQSMLPMLVVRERLDAANGRIISAQKVTAELLGSPVAGALVAIGGAALFSATAMLYAAVGMVLASMPGNYSAERSDKTTTLLSEVGEGLRYLRANSPLRALAVLAGLLNLAGSAYLAVFVLWAVGPGSPMGLHPTSYGVLLALVGVGGAAGALMVEPITERLGEVPTLLGTALAAALLLLIPVAVPDLAAVGPALFALGVASAATNVTIVSMRQRLIPDRLLGRVNATYRLIGMGTMPIGALLGGLVAEHAGVGPVLVGSPLVSILAIVAARRRVTPTAVAQAQHEATLQ